MLHDPALMQRLQQAKLDCISRMQATADWLDRADLRERQALQQCGHRLVGTLGSFSFTHEALLASKLERACEESDRMLDDCRMALAAALRGLEAR